MKDFTEAIESILAGYSDGEMISHTELREILNFQEPEFTGDIEEYNEELKISQFKWLSLIENLRTELLEDYDISLKNIRGEGYQIVPPQEQTRYATDSGIQSIKRELSWMEKTIKHIRLDGLSDNERRENSDARARVSHFRMIFDGRKRTV